NLWRGFEEQRQALGSNPLRSWCRKNFLNYLRLREWRDAHRQLTLTARELKLGAGNAVDGSGHPPYAKSGSRTDEDGEAPSARSPEIGRTSRRDGGQISGPASRP